MHSTEHYLHTVHKKKNICIECKPYKCVKWMSTLVQWPCCIEKMELGNLAFGLNQLGFTFLVTVLQVSCFTQINYFISPLLLFSGSFFSYIK